MVIRIYDLQNPLEFERWFDRICFLEEMAKTYRKMERLINIVRQQQLGIIFSVPSFFTAMERRMRELSKKNTIHVVIGEVRHGMSYVGLNIAKQLDKNFVLFNNIKPEFPDEE